MHFSLNDEDILVVAEYFSDLPENYYRVGIHKLEERWKEYIKRLGEIKLINKCIENLGENTK